MTFGLKNASAMHQRAMNYIFHELITKIVEIYINDVVVKSKSYKEHLTDLQKTLECTRNFPCQSRKLQPIIKLNIRQY
jgi:hypothetical protein